MVLYFAYGSNMSTDELRKYKINPSNWFVVKLINYELRFNKSSSKDGSGKANIEPKESANVLGVVFDVTEEEKENLKGKEKGYKIDKIKVEYKKKLIEVDTYIASEKVDGLKPKQSYLDIIIKGAKEHNLPMNYIRKLESISCIK